MNEKDIENTEIDLLLSGILKRYGYDFRNYSRAYLKRRFSHKVKSVGLQYMSELLPRVLHEQSFFDSLLKDISITVTEMFRDPYFYAAFRRQVISSLKTYPFVKIWHAGCATGEEVYSMAILLQEEGLLDRTQIYATDMNNYALEVAESGIYPLERMREYTENYNNSDSKASLSDYYHTKYNNAKMLDVLKKKITFSNHNLVTDGVFGEMNVVVCRNVLIYFDESLQKRVLSLFYNSLCHGGFLCLGTKESLRCFDLKNNFKVLAAKESIYKKMMHAEAKL